MMLAEVDIARYEPLHATAFSLGTDRELYRNEFVNPTSCLQYRTGTAELGAAQYIQWTDGTTFIPLLHEAVNDIPHVHRTLLSVMFISYLVHPDP